MAIRGLPREPGWRFVCTVYTRSVEQLGGEDRGWGGETGVSCPKSVAR